MSVTEAGDDASFNSIAELTLSAARILDHFPAEQVQPSDAVRKIKLRGVPEFDFYLRPPNQDTVISPLIRHFGVWEPFETEIMLRLFPHYSNFIDVGANIGWYSAIARLVMPRGSLIHAFEPNQASFAVLAKNVPKDSSRVKVSLNQGAVSDTSGTGKLYISSENVGDHHLYESLERRQSVPVPVSTLNEILGIKVGSPVLVKMDTQGSEPRIVRGGDAIFSLSSASSTYVMEFWPFGIASSGESPISFIDQLAALPQAAFVISARDHTLRPISWDELKIRTVTDLAPETRQFVDLVLVTPGKDPHSILSDLIA